ncbi:hypothetical protein Drose_10060 [Dactylosporangium roseum]|uniref:Uncharacterized protein n=1 Tax=Dactylosporangium roseum TaxID=47989 RepID=A0ABY5Z8X9_9ACTN|nr:hypothetical protein [Dactylosporangium roseum]UWZ38543.1 hypothetical protein Drose_10060 [Dactylosporangium roseum]
MSAAGVFGAALRRAARGERAGLRLLDRAGRPLRRIDAAWYGELRPGDNGLLDRCGADTIDLGCGPAGSPARSSRPAGGRSAST